ncbi:MAG: flagellar biosynthesis anti-sigma factor FlgM [Clostridia bacterium]|nr:flagellar biosynthesis anti-sigma factor FlgM [Clostridia bacterium]
MKVNGIQAQNIYESYQKNLKQDEAVKDSSSQKAQGDTLELSPGAADLQEAGTFARKTSDDGDTQRTARITDIKNQIDAGTYNVSSQDVARSVLKGMIMDQKA